jgi:hypothetical protein
MTTGQQLSEEEIQLVSGGQNDPCIGTGGWWTIDSGGFGKTCDLE